MTINNPESNQINESTQEIQKDSIEENLENPENAENITDNLKNSWDLDNLVNKEINNVETAKKLIKDKYPDLDINGWKDYQIINQAKKIQKEMQALRRFDNRKWKIDAHTNNTESLLQSISYREENDEIILKINNQPEVRIKTKYSTWNTTFDSRLDKNLKANLDAETYWRALSKVHNILEHSLWMNRGKDDFKQIREEVEAKMLSQWRKENLREYFKNKKNIENFFDAFKWIPVEQLNEDGFTDMKKKISELLMISWNYTFNRNDFDFGWWISFDHENHKITVNEEKISMCNAKITWVDDEWIHLLNTVTWKTAILNAEIFKNAENAETERKNQRDYIKNKEKEVRKRLGISENTEITSNDIKRIETEMLFDGITNDKKMFDIFYNRVLESNASWFPKSIFSEEISWLLEKFNIHENIHWRWCMNVWNMNWKQAVKLDFWNTQIYLCFWEQPKITHEKITQEQIDEKIKEEEKSPNYKRALNIIETSKDSWKIDLSDLNLTSKEVWNLFAEANIKDIRNLEIDLSWNRITTIPKILFQEEWIKHLDLNSNLITEISTDIFKNFNRDKCSLEYLSLHWNVINQIPEELFININKLKNFWISSKEITKIPNSIWNLVNLEELNISATWIESIPDSIIKCKNLKSFYADYCKLSNLPDWLWELTNLESLNLSENKLSTIPDLSKLNKLEHLDISWNENLKSIPEISYAELKTLRITWCDNTTPPIEEFKSNLNKLYPNIQVYSEKYINSRIDTWEDIKQIYFSWWNKTENISWNPNDFFNDNEQYEQMWLTADSLDSWLSKAKEDLWIEENTPIFYVERKRSDWTVSIHVFTKVKEKD